MTLRKRTLADTCKPWVALIDQATRLCLEANILTRPNAVHLLDVISNFVMSINAWAGRVDVAEDDRKTTRVRAVAHSERERS